MIAYNTKILITTLILFLQNYTKYNLFQYNIYFFFIDLYDTIIKFTFIIIEASKDQA